MVVVQLDGRDYVITADSWLDLDTTVLDAFDNALLYHMYYKFHSSATFAQTVVYTCWVARQHEMTPVLWNSQKRCKSTFLV